MMSILSWILGASFLTSLISLVGRSIVFLGEERFRRFIHYAMSLAVGTLLGVVFLDLLPEALELAGARTVFFWVLVGFLLFFILERGLFLYHCRDGECPVHAFGYLSLIGDAIHNFLDGVIIALAFLVNIPLGIATSFAVIFHEVPQEMSDFLVLLHAGFERRKALFYNFLIALTTVIGAFLTYLFAGVVQGIIGPALGLVAGNFLYIAAVNLVPELHEAKHARKKTVALAQISLIILGILLIYFVGVIFEH